MERSSALTAEDAIARVRELSSQISTLEAAAAAVASSSSSSPIKLRSKFQNYTPEGNQESSSPTSSSSSFSSSSSSSLISKGDSVNEKLKNVSVRDKESKNSSNLHEDGFSTSDHQNSTNVVKSDSMLHIPNRNTFDRINGDSNENQNENYLAVNIVENSTDYPRGEGADREENIKAPSASSSRRASINVSSSSSFTSFRKSNLNQERNELSNGKHLSRKKKEFTNGGNDNENDENCKNENLVSSAGEDNDCDDSDDRLTIPTNEKLFYVNEVRS